MKNKQFHIMNILQTRLNSYDKNKKCSVVLLTDISVTEWIQPSSKMEIPALTSEARDLFSININS